MMIKLSPFFAPMMMMIVTVTMMIAKSPFFFLACPPYTETPLSLHLFHPHKLFCPLTQFGRTISLFLAPSSTLRGEFTLTILNKALSVPFLVSSFWDYLWSKIPIKRVSVTWIIHGQLLSAQEQSEGLQNYDPQFSKTLLFPATNPPILALQGEKSNCLGGLRVYCLTVSVIYINTRAFCDASNIIFIQFPRWN